MIAPSAGAPRRGRTDTCSIRVPRALVRDRRRVSDVTLGVAEFGAGVVASAIGTGVSPMRGGHRSREEEPPEEEGAAADLRIGDAEPGAPL